MYNRYIPQSDGTFRRSTVQEKPPQAPNPERGARRENPAQPTQTPPQPHAEKCPQQPQPRPEPRQRPRGQRPTKPCPILQDSRENSAGTFLRNLLAKDIDTGDLLIIVLLLLMAGDCPEDQNNALLTLAIYLFL